MFKKIVQASLVLALLGLVAACSDNDDHDYRGNNKATCNKNNHGDVHCDNGRYGSNNKQVNGNCHKDWKGNVQCDKD